MEAFVCFDCPIYIHTLTELNFSIAKTYSGTMQFLISLSEVFFYCCITSYIILTDSRKGGGSQYECIFYVCYLRKF